MRGSPSASVAPVTGTARNRFTPPPHARPTCRASPVQCRAHRIEDLLGSHEPHGPPSVRVGHVPLAVLCVPLQHLENSVALNQVALEHKSLQTRRHLRMQGDGVGRKGVMGRTKRMQGSQYKKMVVRLRGWHRRPALASRGACTRSHATRTVSPVAGLRRRGSGARTRPQRRVPSRAGSAAEAPAGRASPKKHGDGLRRRRPGVGLRREG